MCFLSSTTIPNSPPDQAALKQKRHHSKQKFHKLSEEVSADGNYGLKLPNIAFDYSEYFISALIERNSDSDDLYLTMFLLGHNVIDNDLPFESISTEEEVLYQWAQAIRNFKPNRNVSIPSSNSRSGLICVIKNDDPKIKNSPTLTSQAFWVQSSPSFLSSKFGQEMSGNIEILRCRFPFHKMKGIVKTYSFLSLSEQSKVFVDIVRKKSILPHTSLPSESEVVSGEDVNNIAIISFTIPWKPRQTGYGLQLAPPPTHGMQAKGIAGRGVIGTYTESNNSSSKFSTFNAWQPKLPLGRPVVVGCMANLRPLHPLGADVGIPRLLEWIEHYLTLGFGHLFIGATLDWESRHMHRHVETLKSYINSGKITISSLSLPGKDDVAGFNGLHINDLLAEWIFLNQCLYYSKGVADFVVNLHANEFIFPIFAGNSSSFSSSVSSQNNNSTIIHSILEPYEVKKNHSTTSIDIGRRTGLVPSLSLYSLASTPFCYLSIQTLQMKEPKDEGAEQNFLIRGPGDESFGKDFYKNSELTFPSSDATSVMAIAVLPTRDVWMSAGHDSASCNPPFTFSQRQQVTPGVSSSSSVPMNSAALSVSTASAIIYGESFDPKRSKLMNLKLKKNSGSDSDSNSGENGASAKHKMLYISCVRNSSISFTEIVHSRLRSLNLGSVSAIEAHKEAARKSFVPGRYVKIDIGRSSLRPPYWQTCDREHLRDVINRVFVVK